MRSAPLLWVVVGACGTALPPPELTPEAVTEILAGAIGHGELRIPPLREEDTATITLRSAVWVKSPGGLTDTIEFGCSLQDGTQRFIPPIGGEGLIRASRPTWETLRGMDGHHVIVLLQYQGGRWLLADRYDETALLPYSAVTWDRVVSLVERHRALTASAQARAASPRADQLFERLCAATEDPDDQLGAQFVALGAEGVPTILRALGDDQPIHGFLLRVLWGGCSLQRTVVTRSQLACGLMARVTGIHLFDLGSSDQREHAQAADSYRALGPYALASPDGRVSGWRGR